MQLVKDGDLTEILGTKGLTDTEEMIRHMVYFYQAMLLPREDWLTKQETQFFIACVIIANKGIRYTSTEAKNIFRNIFNLRRQSDVRGYMKRIEEKKGWIMSDKEQKLIHVHQFFKFENKEHLSLKLDVELKIDNESI